MRGIGPLLRKDIAWGKHRLAALLVLFVLVPAVVAGGTLFFEHTLPENSPIAITPTDEDVTEADLDVVRGGVAFVSDPKIVDSRDAAFSQLRREQVYAVIEVPPGITDTDGSATIDISVHGSVTIYRMPSQVLGTMLSDSLDEMLPADITGERHVIGDRKSLSEYLLPTMAMLVVMLVAFAYVPAVLAREAQVFDRLRLDSSLHRLVVAKLVFVTGLVLVSLGVIYLVGRLLGYGLQPPSVVAVGVLVLSFLGLSGLSISISFATDFSDAGRVLNVVCFFVLVVLSNLAYPAGFFSPLSKFVARHNPLHYAMIVVRSELLRSVPARVYAPWIAAVAVVAGLSLSGMWLMIETYKRGH